MNNLINTILFVVFSISIAHADTFTYTLSYDVGSRVTLVTAGGSNQASYDWQNDERIVTRLGEAPVGLFLWDIDGDGKAKPLTDGLLILRHLFGFTDNALISNAVEGSATRTSAADIQAYLQTGVDTKALDIDGDSTVKPLTDGLLVLRYLFGFKGDSLVNNAVGNNATRQTAEEIEAYLTSKMP